MRNVVYAGFFFLAMAGVVFTSTSCGGGGGGSGGSGGGSVNLTPNSLTIGANGLGAFLALQNGTPVDVSFSQSGGATINILGTGHAQITFPPSGTVTITATTFADSSDSTVVTIDPTRATVYGRVVDEDLLSGIGGVTVQFKNGSNVVASTQTLANGYFSVGVPTTANRMHISTSGLSSFYYRQYRYQSMRYTMLDPNCSVTLPALVAGTTHQLSGSIQITNTNGPPPPPPNGCTP